MIKVKTKKQASLSKARQYNPPLSDKKPQSQHETSRVNEPFYRQIFESLEDYAVFTTDIKGIINSWNSGAERIFRYTEKEIIGQKAAILFTSEDRRKKAPEQELQTAMKKGRAADEKWHLRSDGTRFWASGLVFPLKDDKGKALGFTKIARDLTQQKVYEDERHALLQELDVEKKKLVDVFENAPAFMAILRGKEYVFEMANTAYYQLVGHRDILGKPVLKALPEIKGQGYIELLNDVLLTGKPFVGTELKVMLQRIADGPLDERYINLIYKPIADAKGNRTGIFAHGYDVTELVMSRQKVEESEARYRTLFNSIDEGFCVIEVIFNKKNQPIDYRFLEINPVFEKQTGLVNAVGKTILELVPNLEKHWIDLYGNVALTGKSTRFVNRSDAMGRNFDVYATRVGGSKSRKVALLFNDITERVGKEDAMRDSEERFRTLIEKSTDAIQIVTPDGTILYTSESIKNVLGYTAEELQGQGVAPFMHPDDLAYFSEKLQQLLKGPEKQITLEYRVKHKDGSWAWLETTGVNHLKTPNINALVGTFRNITERKRIEAELIESEKRFRTMADNIPNLAWMANADGYIYWYNSRWYEYTGKTPKQMEGWGWQSVHDPAVLPHVLEEWNKSIATGEPFEMVFPICGADKIFRPFLTRVMPVRDEKGTIIQWFGTNTDITKQKELERQKDDFLGIASHELKTPVTSIKAYGQVLEARFRRSGDTKSADQLAKMDAQVDKLSNLIGDLLDVTKIQSGKMLFHEEYFDFNALVCEVIEEVQRTTEKHTIVKKLTVTKSVYGDRERIGQVLTNLITNATKYSPNANKIIVYTKVDKKNITLCVQDFGVGIPFEKQGRVFEQFFRVSGPMRDTFPGLGLGLYISSEIIKREGGKIWVESIEGKGSTFSFSLPIDKSKNKKRK